jgi:hypothetical protein
MGRTRGRPVKMMSPIYYDTKILNTHGSASDDTVIRVEGLMARKDAEYPEDPARKVCNGAEDPVTTRARNLGCVQIWNLYNSNGRTWFQKNTTQWRSHLPPARYKS